jgi:hypothetical protein
LTEAGSGAREEPSLVETERRVKKEPLLAEAERGVKEESSRQERRGE